MGSKGIAIFKYLLEQEACIKYLDKVLWGGNTHLLVSVARKADRARVSPWISHERACKLSSFPAMAHPLR